MLRIARNKVIWEEDSQSMHKLHIFFVLYIYLLLNVCYLIGRGHNPLSKDNLAQVFNWSLQITILRCAEIKTTQK